ncbi:MAG TPA: molybdopterin molybdotransferase MoeA [Gemmatales bacterium]|nr:molybdopterin molybdotransferase MoeA [Gemmatales bacterium]
MALMQVADAQALVLQHTQRLAVETVGLSPAVLGRVLAEDIASDIDSPPFDKSMVDGFALRSEDAAEGIDTFRIIEEIMAGQVAKQPVGLGEAASIMTGAPLPLGGDAVVMHEHTKFNTHQMRLMHPVKARQNIMARASEMMLGETVLSAGSLLCPQELGLLATVGRTSVQIYRTPRVAILSTGDEIIEPGQPLASGQIRNSNASLLMALVTRSKAIPNYLGIAHDTLESLRPLISTGLQSDVMLITGGVSAGKVDLVPDVLAEAGVKAIFHKVALKPGKPLYFGTLGNTLVFGLPGNPVSGLVGFELFVRPALRKLMGRCEPFVSPTMKARSGNDFSHKSDRPTYYPVQLRTTNEGWVVHPVNWKGSGDLRSICTADGFAVLPPGEVRYSAGDFMDVLVPEFDHWS